MLNTERLIELRKHHKLTQADVAKKLNTSRPNYVRYERGNHQPPNETLVLLAEMFGVTTDYLLKSDSDATLEQKEKADPNHEPTNKEEKRLIEAFRAVKSEKIKQAVIDILEDSANPATKKMKVKSNVEREYEDEKEQ